MADDDTKALVRADAGQVDAYERDYMGEGTVRYRDKMVAGSRLNLFFAALTAVMLGAGALQGTLLSSLAALPIIAAIWLIFGVLRVSVTDTHVAVQYALWGPKIPLASIESVTAIKYSWASFGGWGIRRGADGWMYNMIGDGGNAVRIVWSERGAQTVTYVGTRTAAELARQIERAMQALPAAEEEPPALTSAAEEPPALTSGE
ncbi:MAG: hypothetical protein R3A79_26605 [Nannocystaceae bacterium]